jgi:hypothetical protein
MLSKEKERYLEKIWTDVNHPAAFVGPHKMYQIIKKEGKHKIGLRFIKRFLSSTDAYSLQKRVQRNFKRRHIVVDTIDTLWDGDLQDVRNISKYNDGIQFILVLQDVFSRYLFTYPLKQKSANEVIKALKEIFSKGRRPRVLRTDKGSEFKNRWVKAFLKKENVHPIYTENETKSSFAERSIQNLENRMQRMFNQNQSYEFVEQLPAITKNINDTPSRPLGGMAPSEVTEKNVEETRYSAYLARLKKPKRSQSSKKKRIYKFKVNDRVRITHTKHVFQREYGQKWTGEIFVVSQRYLSQGIPVYKLKDFAEEPITGTFYEQELQRVDKKEDEVWKVEKIIKTRKKGVEEVLVSWHQWPSKFNSWIKKSELSEV